MMYFDSKEARNGNQRLPYAVLAYRTTTHKVTEYSPHYLVYGQELRLPIGDDLRIIIRKSNLGNYDEHVIDLAKKMRQVSELISQEKGEEMSAFKEIL